MSTIGYFAETPTPDTGPFGLTVSYWNSLGKAASCEDMGWRETLQRCDPEFLNLIESAYLDLKKFNLLISTSDIEDDLVLDIEGKAGELEDELGGTYIEGFISIHFPYGETEDDTIPEIESDWSNAEGLLAIVRYVEKNYRNVDELFRDNR